MIAIKKNSGRVWLIRIEAGQAIAFQAGYTMRDSRQSHFPPRDIQEMSVHPAGGLSWLREWVPINKKGAGGIIRA
ncbi:MAG: hypothetical protein CW742_11850 [Methanoregula sp.]|nr:MAG: hypothetical protein CW742_11850 [Methanoregula sp.]